MPDNRTGQQIELQDGRVLGYAEYGAPDGTPVFYFHGFPGSRLDYQLVDAGDAAMETNARIIAPDRPGMGLSTFKPGREILDWPGDVAELADALQIDDFAVLGVSGGGPYAAASAQKIPERLIATGLVCGMGPASVPGMADGVSWRLPGQPSLIRRFVLMLTSMGLRRDPDQFLSKSKETLSEPDRQLLAQPEMAALFIGALQEAFRSGVGGANQDAALYTRPWGFDLEDLTSEVHLWHGGQDKNVPVSVAHYVSGAIPHCSTRLYPEEGHLTLPHNRIGEILTALVS